MVKMATSHNGDNVQISIKENVCYSFEVVLWQLTNRNQKPHFLSELWKPRFFGTTWAVLAFNPGNFRQVVENAAYMQWVAHSIQG